MANRWLVKEEPTHYSFQDLTNDGRTTWEGVKNPLAQKHLRGIKQGDLIFYYHTGDQKAVVGIARALSDAYPDPKEKEKTIYVVDVKGIRKLPKAVPLPDLRADKKLFEMPFLIISRIAVSPLTAAEYQEILRLGGTK